MEIKDKYSILQNSDGYYIVKRKWVIPFINVPFYKEMPIPNHVFVNKLYKYGYKAIFFTSNPTREFENEKQAREWMGDLILQDKDGNIKMSKGEKILFGLILTSILYIIWYYTQ